MTTNENPPSGNESALTTNAAPDPWSPLDQLFQDLHDNFYSNFGAPVFRWVPSVRASSLGPARTDVVDRGESFELTAELPGAEKTGIEVTVNGSSVQIKARQHEQTEEKGANYLRRERFASGFEREFELPEAIRPDEVKARYENGVLTVTVPKAHPVVAKKVAVE